jgi:rSAM/selenodomain-associated transferase 1
MTHRQETPPAAQLLIFAKAPQPGVAKTRLIPLFGAEGAARLQARLTRRAIATALATGLGPVELWCAPSAELPFFKALQTEWLVSLHSQCGGDLGEKMWHAATCALSARHPVLILGTDCPRLTPLHLQNALATLKQGHEAVLIPADDGGYVLLGLTRVAPELFQDIAWGTDRVLVESRARLVVLGWRFAILDPLPDLDRPADCAQLAREHPRLWQALTTEEHTHELHRHP